MCVCTMMCHGVHHDTHVHYLPKSVVPKCVRVHICVITYLESHGCMFVSDHFSCIHVRVHYVFKCTFTSVRLYVCLCVYVYVDRVTHGVHFRMVSFHSELRVYCIIVFISNSTSDGRR